MGREDKCCGFLSLTGSTDRGEMKAGQAWWTFSQQVLNLILKGNVARLLSEQYNSTWKMAPGGVFRPCWGMTTIGGLYY